MMAKRLELIQNAIAAFNVLGCNYRLKCAILCNVGVPRAIGKHIWNQFGEVLATYEVIAGGIKRS